MFVYLFVVYGCHLQRRRAYNFGLKTGANDDTAALAGGDVGAREEDVLLVLVESARVRYGLVVLDDRDRLAGEKRLIDTQRRRVDRRDADVGRDLVADCFFLQEFSLSFFFN